MPKIDHIHTFKKMKSRPSYFICADPKCYSTAPKSLLEGKASLCNLCGNEFVLTREDLRRAKPRCLACSKTNKAISADKALGLIQGLDMFKEPDGAV